MTINIKLILISLINLVMLTLVGFVGYRGVTLLIDAEHKLEAALLVGEHQFLTETNLLAVYTDILELTLAVNKIAGDSDGSVPLATLDKHLDQLAQENQLASKHADTEQRKAIVDGFRPEIEKIISDSKRIAAQLTKNPLELDQAILEEFKSEVHALEKQFSVFDAQLVLENDELIKQSDAAAASVKRWMLIFGLLSAAIGVGVSWSIGKSLNKSLVSIIQNLWQRSAATQEMNETLQGLSQSVASSATEQAAAVQESVASMEEMSSMIGQTVEGATRSMEAAQQATTRSADGVKIMNEMVSSMESIHHANQQLREMTAIIKEISTKTGVINDIVFKTQLLAFNASIEAARAGQHGRGFAVVAEEVGNLADMSGNAAKEIQTLLDSSDKQVSTMVEITEQRVKQGRAVSERAMAAFSLISSDIATILEQVQSINNAMREQEVGVQQTQTAMTQIDIAAQQTSSASVGVSRSVGDLNRETLAVNEIIVGLKKIVFGTRSTGTTSSTQDATEVIELDRDIPASRNSSKEDFNGFRSVPLASKPNWERSIVD